MNNTFAQRLVNARKIRCMSQRELCNVVDGKVSPTAIVKYEKGLMMPSSDVLIVLSKALEMKLDYLRFRFVCLNEDFEKALEILREVILNSTFDEFSES